MCSSPLPWRIPRPDMDLSVCCMSWIPMPHLTACPRLRVGHTENLICRSLSMINGKAETRVFAPLSAMSKYRQKQ